LKKLLVVSVIVLFLGVAIAPSINSDKIEIEPETLNDNDREIISIIDGSCLDTTIGDIGIFFNVEIWAGYDTWIDIIGYTSILPPRRYSASFLTYVKAPIFIGRSYHTSPGRQYVRGIALGDIEWID
jgi:hypothetical protein